MNIRKLLKGIVEGIATFNIRGNNILSNKEIDRILKRSDTEAIANDRKNVGNYIKVAINKFKDQDKE